MSQNRRLAIATEGFRGNPGAPPVTGESVVAVVDPITVVALTEPIVVVIEEPLVGS